MFLKFYSLMLFLKKNFMYLPKDISEELISVLEDYRDLCRVSKYMKGE